MKTAYEETDVPSGSGARFAMVIGEWHKEHSSRMADAAHALLTGHDVSPANIETFRSPGSFEIPVICRALCETKRFDAILAFGVILRGQTSHFDMLVTGVTQGLMTLMTTTGVPILNEILATESLDQIVERTKPGPGNKGREAALAALKAVAVIRKIQGK